MFHDCGMFDKTNTVNPSGCVGSVRYFENIRPNTGLSKTFANLFVSRANTEDVSAADIIAMGAVVAIRHCGGPSIPYFGGRLDQPLTEAARFSQNPGRLPLPSDSFLEISAKFLKMGLDGHEMAAAGNYKLMFSSIIFFNKVI